MANSTPLDGVLRAIERAETPYVLFPDDIATSFRLAVPVARAAMRRGLFGPWFLLDGEPAVLRDHLRQHLTLRASGPSDSVKEVLPGGSASLRGTTTSQQPPPAAPSGEEGSKHVL